MACGDSKKSEKSSRDKRKSHRMELGNRTERDEKTQNISKRESSQSSSETSSRSSRSRPRIKPTSRREEDHDESEQQQEYHCEFRSAEMNNNEGMKGHITSSRVIVSEPIEANIISLGQYIQGKLLALGLKKNIVILEVDKMMVTLKQILEYAGKGSFKHQEKMLHLLDKFGFKSGHISVRLAAVLVVER